MAVKQLLRQHHANEKLRTRFGQEAKTLAMLQHQNIVTIYDTVQNELCIVMEYLPEAKDLGRTEHEQPGYCRDHFDQLVTGLTAALEYAHSKQVIHRDLKYENVLVSEGKLKISDFGLAAIVREATQPLSASGTLPYMAPEIFSQKDVDARADLYALGVLFYHVWTGQFPFEGTDFEIARAHVDRPPVDPTLHNPRLPRGLSDIVLKLLEKDPSQRFPSASALRDAYYDRVGNKDALTVTDVAEFQNRLAGIFAVINKKRAPYDILTNIQIRASGLSRYAMARPTPQNIEMQVKFLCKLFGWSFAMATDRRIVAREALLSKYRNKCPYCRSAECQCPATGKEKSLEEIDGDIPNYTSFGEISEMFRRIYGKRNTDLVVAIHKLHVELGELSEAVVKMLYTPGGEGERQVGDEIADIFAWLFAIANLLPETVDMSRALVDYFDRKCARCKHAICRCDLQTPVPQLLLS